MDSAFQVLRFVRACARGGKQEDQYFRDEGYNLEEWKVDTDFNRLMTLIQTEGVDAIYVDEENRLFRARSREFRGRVLDLIEQNGVRVITKNGEVSTGSLAMEIVSAVGADDKRAMLRKCHEAKITRLTSEGRPPTGRAPFGLNWSKREKKWEIVPEEARIIRCAVGLSIGKIYDDMPDSMKGLIELSPGGMPDKEVANILTGVGFTKRITKRSISHGIDYSGVKAIFASDTCRGKIIFNLKKADQVGNPKFKNGSEQRTKYEVKVPRILSDEDWDSLCIKRNRRRKWAKRNVQHEYLCKDFLMCSVCGVPLAARPKDTERYLKREKRLVRYPPTLYYTCARKQKMSGFRCSANKCHSSKIIDGLVWSEITRLITEPEFLTLRVSDLGNHDQIKKRIEKLSSAKLGLSEDLIRLKEISKNLAKRLGKGLLCEEQYLIANSENVQEQRRITEYLQSTEEELKSLCNNNEKTDFNDLVESIKNQLPLSSFEDRRNVLKSLVSSIRIEPCGQITLLLKHGLQFDI